MNLPIIKKPPTRFLVSTMLEGVIENLGMVGGIVFTSFMLYSGLRDEQIAMVLSIVGLAQLVQIVSTVIYTRFTNKKQVIFILRLVRSVSLVVLPLLPIIFPGLKPFSFIVMFTFIRYIALNLIGGGFVEWNDSFVAEEKKGIYYGTRNVLNNAALMVLSLAIGKVLDAYENNTILFFLIFMFSLALNIMQWQILRKVPFSEPVSKTGISLKDTIMLPLKDKRFVRFIVFSVLWSLSLSLGRPLLNTYAIKYMHYSYHFLAITVGVTAFIKLFSGIYNGKQIDRQGAKKVIVTTGLGFAVTTFLFVFLTPNLPQLYFWGVVLNGIFMIGFNVSKFRLEMQLSKGVYMNAYVSMNVFFSGLTLFLGTYFSGVLIKAFSVIQLEVYGFSINPYQMLFFSSGICHIVAIIYFLYTFGSDTGVTPKERIGYE